MLFDNAARAIDGASQAVVERHVFYCTQAYPAYGKGVAEAIARLTNKSARKVVNEAAE